MDFEKPSYYSILTPEVRYNKNLSPSEKLFYSEITALTNTNGYCYASNEYFCRLYDVNDRTIRRWLENLKKENLIKIEYQKDNRKIYINTCLNFKNIKSKKNYKKAKKINTRPLDKYELENINKNIMEGMEIL